MTMSKWKWFALVGAPLGAVIGHWYMSAFVSPVLLLQGLSILNFTVVGCSLGMIVGWIVDKSNSLPYSLKWGSIVVMAGSLILLKPIGSYHGWDGLGLVVFLAFGPVILFVVGVLLSFIFQGISRLITKN